jgi:hypothetical protein
VGKQFDIGTEPEGSAADSPGRWYKALVKPAPNCAPMKVQKRCDLLGRDPQGMYTRSLVAAAGSRHGRLFMIVEGCLTTHFAP